jgi:ribonucleoside-diphosphate reductase beta chain
MPLLEARKTYKPFEYPWAYEFWKRQQQVHWMPEEVPLGEDCRDWAQKISEHERNLLTQIFRFFTQADVEVQDCYHERYGRVFKPTEIKMMLAAFSNMETVHIAAYAPARHHRHARKRIRHVPRIRGDARQARLHAQFGVDSDEDIARTLAMFGGFTEGLQLFASFAMLMNFPRFNKMKGMGQIVSWSVRDESLHCEGIIKLFHTFVQGTRLPDQGGEGRHHRLLPEDRAAGRRLHRPRLRDGPGAGHDRQGHQALHPLHRRLAPAPAWACPKSTWSKDHPLPWLTPLLNGVEHANFFETRATEYSKGATRGDWTLLGNAHIVHISGGYHQHMRPALHIADGVDLAVPASPCLADTIGQAPPFAPPAVRCALMQVLSMKSLSGTPSAPARALKMPSQMPRSAQRTKRL